MAETIYDQIEKAEKALGLETTLDIGDDDGKNDGGSDGESSDDGRGRRQGGSEHGEKPGQAEGSGDGAGRRRSARKGTSPDKSSAPSEDAGTLDRSGGEPRGSSKSTPREGERTQEDARPSHEDGETLLVEEKPLSNKDQAAARIRIRELEAKLAKYEATKIASPLAPVVETKPAIEEKPAIDPKAVEPDKNVNYQAWLEWKIENGDNTIKQQAELLTALNKWKETTETTTREQDIWNKDAQAFQEIEKRYEAKNPDYGNAVNHARETYFKALKLAEPRASDAQIDQAINNEIMGYARKWASEGLDPAQEFYDMAIARFGYEKADSTPAEENAPLSSLQRAVDKPNLRMVSSNKRRSATPLSGGGQGGSVPLSKQSIATMTNAEIGRLTPEDIAALESM